MEYVNLGHPKRLRRLEYVTLGRPKWLRRLEHVNLGRPKWLRRLGEETSGLPRASVASAKGISDSKTSRFSSEWTQFAGDGGGIEAGEHQAIVNEMDAISEDWGRLRLAVCNDCYKRKLITQDDTQRQVKCFDDRLDQQRKLVRLLEGPDTSSASKLAAQLTEAPHACK